MRYPLVIRNGTLVVEGQQHGAIAMGLSGALLEHMRYDEHAQSPDYLRSLLRGREKRA